MHDEILKMYAESPPILTKQQKQRKYYASYRRKVRQSETNEETAQRRLCDKKHKQSIRANETPKQSQERKKRNRIKTTKTRFSQKIRSETIEDEMASFKTECRKQPVYICTSCHRLLWRKGVLIFSMKNYDGVDSDVARLVLAEKHRISSADGSIYICHSCHKTLQSGTLPAQSKANYMYLEKIPDEITYLDLHVSCSLEFLLMLI